MEAKKIVELKNIKNKTQLFSMRTKINEISRRQPLPIKLPSVKNLAEILSEDG